MLNWANYNTCILTDLFSVYLKQIVHQHLKLLIFYRQTESFNTRFDRNFRIFERTSDSTNGNHSVSLPIILMKIKVDQMIPYSYISSLLVSNL